MRYNPISKNTFWFAFRNVTKIASNGINKKNKPPNMGAYKAPNSVACLTLRNKWFVTILITLKIMKLESLSTKKYSVIVEIKTNNVNARLTANNILPYRL